MPGRSGVATGPRSAVAGTGVRPPGVPESRNAPRSTRTGCAGSR
ncbi:Uncharacterised protein [Mycobacteroides abscessus]|nr:Uncharacterised protein [Mycobacteroides abscessus]